MESKVSKSFLMAIGFVGSLLLTIFSGLFAMVSLCCLVLSVIELDFLNVAASVASGFLAWMIWTIRRDTLV